MTDADIRLAALLAADDAPAQDRVFEAQVVARIEERLTVMKWLHIAAYAVAGIVLVGTALPPIVMSFSGLVHLPPGTGPIVLSTLVVVACVAAAWRYMKPLTDWRALIAWG